MTEPTTPAGRALLAALPPTWWPVTSDKFLHLVLAIESEARAECRDADHIGQITQLGEMVDAARAEAEQARAEGRREAVPTEAIGEVLAFTVREAGKGYECIVCGVDPNAHEPECEAETVRRWLLARHGRSSDPTEAE